MRRLVLTGLVAAALASPAVILGQEGGARRTADAQSMTVLGTVSIPRAVRIDGKPLPRGTYQIRLATELPPPVVGQSPDAARYVEFVREGKVVGREVATVVSNDEIAAISESRRPSVNSTKVETLKGNDYLRVWINRAGANYLIHLPTAA